MLETAEKMIEAAGQRLERIVYTAAEIRERVAAMGEEIARHYEDAGDLLVLGLLKGSFVFLADLVREIPLPLHVDFLVASSYGAEKVTSGEVQLLYQSASTLKGRNVLVVEDIIDSGTTVARLMPLLRARGPKSLEICALLHKRIKPLEWEPRWVGFDAPRDFLIGYGLDYSENFRHLPFIASLRD